jgi:hypothetical protein
VLVWNKHFLMVASKNLTNSFNNLPYKD